jgi:hypothetical protein
MELALQLAPTLERYQEVYKEVAMALRVADETAIGARCDLLFMEMMDEVESASNWPRPPGDNFFDPRSFGMCMRRAMPSADPDDNEYDKYGNYRLEENDGE